MDTYFFKDDQIAIILSETGESDPRELLARCFGGSDALPWPAADVDFFERGDLCLLLARPSSPLRSRVRRGDPRICRRS